MREIRSSGSEGGARFNPLSLPLSLRRSSPRPPPLLTPHTFPACGRCTLRFLYLLFTKTQFSRGKAPSSPAPPGRGRGRNHGHNRFVEYHPPVRRRTTDRRRARRRQPPRRALPALAAAQGALDHTPCVCCCHSSSQSFGPRSGSMTLTPQLSTINYFRPDLTLPHVFLGPFRAPGRERHYRAPKCR